MADAAGSLAAMGYTVHFVTVEPKQDFRSAGGQEPMIQLLARYPDVQVTKAMVGSEFEFGTQRYRAHIYASLLAMLPPGTPVILSDDASVWQGATSLSGSYPLIGVLHSDESHYYELARQHARHIAYFACVSRRVRQHLIETLPGIEGSTAVIPCGIHLSSFSPVAVHDAVLHIAYVGRVTHYQKRVGDLVYICLKLAEARVHFHLDVIGDGSERRALEELAGEEGLAENFSFHGWLPQQEVARRLAATDLLLLTSDFEGTPVAMMEALAAGCGVVATRVSGIEDYEHEPGAAQCFRVFETGDVDDAAKKILDLAAAARANRQPAARKMAEQHFSMEQCLSSYLHIINGLSFEAARATRPSLSAMSRLRSLVAARLRVLKLSLSKR
jgi:glycosyltransferase involved in cell wall biosynthesis